MAITHLHEDHFGDLVFLLREATLIKRRTRSLVLAGPEGFAARLETSMKAFFPGGWVEQPRFGLTILEYERERELPVGSATVKPFRVSHACGAPPYALHVSFVGITVGVRMVRTGCGYWRQGR